MGPGMMGGAGPMGWRGQDPGMCAAMSSHIEGQLAFLKAEMKITASQEALWNAYASAARDSAKTMASRCTAAWGGAPSAKMSVPDRLERHEQLMRTRLDSVKAVLQALKPLYAALSQTQKDTADQLLWGSMGMM